MTLCTAAEVKERVQDIAGLTLRAGATDPRIEGIITLNSNAVLSAYGVATVGELTAARQSVAKGACILLSVADLLVSLFPTQESTARLATEYRKRAYADVDRSLTGPSAAQPSARRLGSGLL